MQTDPDHRADTASGTANAVGFCHEDAAQDGSGARYRTDVTGPAEMTEPIIAELRRVYDPEIPVNIYDLGLIYRLKVNDEADVMIEMTLTSPACPVAGMMPLMVRNAVGQVDGVGLIEVEMVWDPPWSQDHLGDSARLELGLL